MTEYSLCANDPIYFINKHVIKLKPFQEDLINQIHQHPSNLINTARQMGVTTVLSAYALWLTLFTEDHKTSVVEPQLTSGIRTLDLIKSMYEKLPEELKEKVVFNNKRELKLLNDSVIKVCTAASDLREVNINLLLVDSAAFRNDLEDLLLVGLPKLQGNYKAVIASTLYKPGWFTDRCIEAEKEQSDYNYIKLPYYLDTKKKRLDRMHAERVIGVDIAKVEWDCTHYLENDKAKPLIDE